MQNKVVLNRYLFLPLSTSLCLIFALTFILSACQAVPASDERLPHLLAVIEIPPGIGLTSQGVVHPDGPAYIMNKSGAVAVLDGPQLVTMITWPQEERVRLHDIAIHPHTGQIYVADDSNDAVHIIEGTEVITTLYDVGYWPELLAVHPESGYVYVASSRRNPETSAVPVVTVISHTEVITHISVPGAPQVLRIGPLDQRLYLGKTVWPESKDRLAIIEGTELVSTTFPAPSEFDTGWIFDMAFHDQSGTLHMLSGPEGVLEWDGTAVEQKNLGALGHEVNNIAVDSSRDLVYVSSWTGPPSYVVVLHQGEIVAELPVGFDPRQIVVDKTHDYVYVANRLAGSMSVIRGTELITTYSTEGVGAGFITVDEAQGYIYVSNSDSPSIAVFGFDEAPARSGSSVAAQQSPLPSPLSR